MEYPHDPYHVRPYPQQPHRGGKELITALKDLEDFFSDEIPDLEKFRAIQARIHKTANTVNDDHLIDMLRFLSQEMDQYQKKPATVLVEKILTQLLKIRSELKHI